MKIFNKIKDNIINAIAYIKHLISEFTKSEMPAEPDPPEEEYYDQDGIAEVDIEDSFRKFYGLREKKNDR